MRSELFYVGLLIFLSFLVAMCIYSLSVFMIKRNVTLEKIGPYECGFEPFMDSRIEFDVQFYLVGILFIIFDVEVVFLFPWAVVAGLLGLYGYIVVCMFIFVLFLAFLYEWIEGGLDWS